MRVEPVDAYDTPAYGTREQELALPETLPGLERRAFIRVIGTAGAALILLDLTGCNDSAPEPQADGKQYVAPIFEHGKGSAAAGCVVVAPPVFTSEEEALEIIKDELAKAGVRFTRTGVELARVKIKPGHEAWAETVAINGQEEYRQAITDSPPRPLRLDLMDPKLRVGVLFVSLSRFFELGGQSSETTVQVYPFKAIAKRVAEHLKGAEKGTYFAVFYDPADGVDRESESALRPMMFNSGDRDAWIKIWEQAKKEAHARSAEQIREQARDFASWLKEQGMLSGVPSPQKGL